MYEYRRLSKEEQQKVVQERIQRGFPRHRPPHLTLDNAHYLITAACYEHHHHINTPARLDAALQHIQEKLAEIDAGLEAWSILANHYHLLLHAPSMQLLRKTIGVIHGRLSFDWNKEDDQRGRSVWYRFSDRLIRSERHYFTTLNYIHFNPVRHKYVDSPYDWAWSSVHWYREAFGKQWLRDLWIQYPLKSYGEGWDEID